MLNGVPLIRHTIRALLSEPRVAKVVVVLSPEDTDWHEGCLPDNATDRVHVVRSGGATRADSVINGINWLLEKPNVDSNDWVLVHDAARPCLSPTQIDALLTELSDDPVGGCWQFRWLTPSNVPTGKPVSMARSIAVRSGWRKPLRCFACSFWQEH